MRTSSVVEGARVLDSGENPNRYLKATVSGFLA
jgi:hypothetical protein